VDSGCFEAGEDSMAVTAGCSGKDLHGHYRERGLIWDNLYVRDMTGKRDHCWYNRKGKQPLWSWQGEKTELK